MLTISSNTDNQVSPLTLELANVETKRRHGIPPSDSGDIAENPWTLRPGFDTKVMSSEKPAISSPYSDGLGAEPARLPLRESMIIQ
jgi:hypothetical protein